MASPRLVSRRGLIVPEAPGQTGSNRRLSESIYERVKRTTAVTNRKSLGNQLPVLLSFYELSDSEDYNSFVENSECQKKDLHSLWLGVCRNGVDGYVFFSFSFRGM